jgi:hypothetical protein
VADGPKKQRARRGEPAPEEATLVVRGDLLDPDALREDATDNFEVYGFWGISVFAEVGDFDLDWIAANKMSEARWLVLFRAGDLFSAGLRLWDTGQSPHYDVVYDDLEELAERIVACPHRIIRNPTGHTGGSS